MEMQESSKIRIIRGILDNLGIEVSREAIAKQEGTVLNRVEQHIKEYINKVGFLPNELTIEGESKKVFRIPNTQVCLISLKATLYSYTENRYGTVEHTDELRNSFWRLFAREINNTVLDYVTKGNIKYSQKVLNLLEEMKISALNPFISSYIGEITLDGQIYNICEYIDDQTPLEMVWKDYFLGTMKHTLIGVPDWKTRTGAPIEVEGKMPQEIIRFDWRNPFEYKGARTKDEAIPDDFANFYTNVKVAKQTGLYVSNIIKEFVAKKGYTFVDTCYFINQRGTTVYSEITPDGMRIRKDAASFDKDLWRIGKKDGEIIKAWELLYADLRGEKQW